MSRLRVVHCIYDDPEHPRLGGGGAHRVFELYRRLTDRVDATVVAGRHARAREGERDGVRYRYAGVARPYALSRLTFGVAASGILRRERYDAGVFDFSVYTPIRVPAGRPVGHVVHMPIGPTARQRWGDRIGGWVEGRERRMLRAARRVQTTSRWMAAQLDPLLSPDAVVDIVHTGVDDVFFDVTRRERSYLLVYGRLDYFQKGLDLVLEAYATLRSRLRAAPELVIAGRGDRSRIEAAIAERGLRGVRVEAPVERPRVLDLLAGALVLLMPSRFEGLPVVPIEAMAAGVPVIAAAVGALEEIIPDEGAGVLIPPGDPDALAAAALALLGDEGRRAGISAAARAAASRYRWDAAADRHLRWLERLAGGPAA